MGAGVKTHEILVGLKRERNDRTGMRPVDENADVVELKKKHVAVHRIYPLIAILQPSIQRSIRSNSI